MCLQLPWLGWTIFLKWSTASTLLWACPCCFLCITFSSPEAVILLVCTKSRDLWGLPTPEVRDSRTHCQIWQIWLAENYRKNFLCMLRNWDWPEVLILGVDQKDRGLWGRECVYNGWHYANFGVWQEFEEFTHELGGALTVFSHNYYALIFYL